MTATKTFAEVLHKGFRVSFDADRILYEQKTEHQHLVLFENACFGRVLMLDDITQVTTADEFVYHEMLSHVPILAHGNARQVLIIGGGDCGLAEEALKHETVERLTQVEIDRAVVDFAAEHFAEMNAAVFEDARFDLVIADGVEFVAASDRRFDVILVDSTDPVGPGSVLFTKEFYAGCRRVLRPGGVLVTQNGVPFMQADELVDSVGHFAGLFADAGCYLATVPTYVGGQMALGWATDDTGLRNVSEAVLNERFAAANLDTSYYTPAVHRAAFALPRYIDELVEKGRRRAA